VSHVTLTYIFVVVVFFWFCRELGRREKLTWYSACHSIHRIYP